MALLGLIFILVICSVSSISSSNLELKFVAVVSNGSIKLELKFYVANNII